MDYYKNVDKISDFFVGVSYNQVTDYDKGAITEPITLSELKAYCKISYSTDDALLTSLISAAREVCENYSYLSFGQRDMAAWINNYNGGTYLPFGPVTEVVSVFNLDGAEVDYKTSGSNFLQILYPKMPLKVVYTTGYATIPEYMKTAVMAQALFMYENRGDAQIDTKRGTSPIAQLILNPFRRV